MKAIARAKRKGRPRRVSSKQWIKEDTHYKRLKARREFRALVREEK